MVLMLAVQCPSMGSSKPPNLEMPFGYSFDNSGSNHSFPSPATPAPGPSLLDDNESKFLENFFNGVSSDQFNYDFFNLNDANNLAMGCEPLPPTFMGTSSSYGHHSQPGSRNGLMSLDFGPANSPLILDSASVPTTSNEVLQAASLLQNVPNEPSHSVDDRNDFHNREIQLLSVDGPDVAETMTQPLTVVRPIFEPRSLENCYANEFIHTDVIFDDQSAALMRNQGLNSRADIRWGSDAAFATSQGFTTPFSRDSVSASERYHLHAIETALSLPQHSALPETSCPPRSVIKKSSLSRQHMNSIEHSCFKNDQNLIAGRRRNFVTQEDRDDDDDDDGDLLFPSTVTSKVFASKRKIETREPVDSTAPEFESIHKRRRSTTSATAKPARENLTEEQKRENHIKSEQKRRTLIREGFEDLNELVPGLQGGGFSKSAVLAQAADWLENLIRGNESLRAKILLMEGRVAEKTE
ncbi:putative bhlh family transcription factor protein [Golovinomyces cichoracearum]|uniref:Putative bhlh family transcription factor protein n=1 Tax=Golovinomyces cichoracearum TaxID=62708 RepID=A0A420HZ93_9PEZI|nr:putative bhlh family transcription factor protein [Golovinomyces cichoracearum]